MSHLFTLDMTLISLNLPHSVVDLAGEKMQTFIVKNFGVIHTRILQDLSMSIEHSGTGYIEDLVKYVCAEGRGYWNAKHRNWLVYPSCTNHVLNKLGRLAIRFDPAGRAPDRLSVRRYMMDRDCCEH
jgi:hypothetical protein